MIFHFVEVSLKNYFCGLKSHYQLIKGSYLWSVFSFSSLGNLTQVFVTVFCSRVDLNPQCNRYGAVVIDLH